MNSPFKLLDSYSQEDQHTFFGRETETEQLVTLFFSSKLSLLYGGSGTGKTSLVSAGLFQHLDLEDWLPVFIRRGSDINVSLERALKELMIENSHNDYSNRERISELIQVIYTQTLKSVILVFDQLEELFFLGSEEEEQQFFEILKELHSPQIPCSIILILREEALAKLTELEKVLPNLFAHRMRVEKASNATVAEIIDKMGDAYGLALGKGVQERIVENLVDESGGVSFSNLQLYMDRLFQRSWFKRGREDYAKKNPPVLSVSLNDVEEIGRIEHILGSFLDDSIVAVERELHARGVEAKGIGVDVLFSLVSVEGTRISQEKDAIISFLQNKRSPGEIEFSLDKFLEMRILRAVDDGSETRYELVHDVLADAIHRKVSAEYLILIKMEKLIHDRFELYQTALIPITEKELDYVEPFLDEITLSQEEMSFLTSSRVKIKKEKRRRSVLIGLAMMIMVLYTGFTFLIQKKQRLEVDQISQENQRLQVTIQSQQRQLDSLQQLLPLN